MNEFLDAYEYLIAHPWFWPGVLALLIIVMVLWLWVRWRRSHRGIEPFRSQGGRVEIAPQTIRGVIRGAALSAEGVERASSRYFQKRNRLQVNVQIHLAASARLRETEAEIKQRIRQALKAQFGMENVDPINIKVKKVIGDPVHTPEVAGYLVEEREPRVERYQRNEEDGEATDKPQKTTYSAD